MQWRGFWHFNRINLAICVQAESKTGYLSVTFVGEFQLCGLIMMDSFRRDNSQLFQCVCPKGVAISLAVRWYGQKLVWRFSEHPCPPFPLYLCVCVCVCVCDLDGLHWQRGQKRRHKSLKCLSVEVYRLFQSTITNIYDGPWKEVVYVWKETLTPV